MRLLSLLLLIHQPESDYFSTSNLHIYISKLSPICVYCKAVAEEKHRLTLQALKEKDPEFYAYLEENDRALLDFGEDEDDEENDAKAPSETSKSKKANSKKATQAVVVTKDLLATWQKQMLSQRSLKALRKLLICVRVASKSASDDDDNENSKKGKSKSVKEETYTIPSAAMFNNVVTAALKYTPLVLSYHVPVKELASGK